MMFNLKLFDFFPETCEFKLTSKGPRKTVSGGIISIILIISSLFISIIMFYNFILNRKPSVIYQTMYDPSSQVKNISIDNLQIALTLWDNGPISLQKPIRNFNSIILENLLLKKNNNLKMIIPK